MPVGPEFVPWMNAEVAEWADRYACPPHRAFPAWALNFIFDVEDDDAFNQTDTLTQGDAGLDGWYHDVEGRVFHLAQAKYLADPVNGTIEPGELDPLIKAALLLKDPANVESGPHHEKLTSVALDLEQALLDDASVTLDFFIAGRISEQGAQMLTDSVSALGPEYSAAFYCTEDLYEMKLADDPIDDLTGQEVRFVVAGPGDYFEIDDLEISGVERAGVAALDGRSLADAVDQWKARLFHGNVRYYLRRTNRVNRRMLETLDSDEDRRAFWLYNNGLTIVADEFGFELDGEARVLVANNPQIVNGAQTSSVLRERRAQLNPGDVSVQCRVIAVAGTDEGRTALARISEFTNSQSPVRAGDLRSNDLRHRKIQGSFAMLPTPVFYERRRGEWQSLDAAKKATYGQRHVSKEDVGQRFLAFKGRPAEAVSKKDSIFHELEAEAFDPSVSSHVFMLAYDLYGQVDSLLKESSSDRVRDLVPSLGQALPDGTVPLEALRRARKLVCAHAVALAREVLVWRYDNVGPGRAEALRDRLNDSESSSYTVVWRQVLKAVRFWYVNLPDRGALKATLQSTEALPGMIALLADNLADANKDDLPTI